MKIIIQKLKSMKLQLFVVLLLAGSIPILVYSSVMNQRYESIAIEQRLEDIARRGKQLSDYLISSRYYYIQDKKAIQLEIREMASAYNGRIIVINSNYRVVDDTFDFGSVDYYNITEEVIRAMRGETNTTIDEEDMSIRITMPVQEVSTSQSGTEKSNAILSNNNAINKNSSIVGVIMLSFSMEDIFLVSEKVGSKAYVVVMTIVLIVMIFAFWYAWVLTRPFKKVTNSIDHMSEGYFDELLSVEGYSEVEQMVESFNKMIGRIKQLENSRQEFVSNVSHELKTPITSIKVLSDSLLMQEDAPVELYREFLVDIADEIERENKIINDLLSLVKMDKTSGELNITHVNINELLELSIKRLRPIAAKRNIELVFESFRPVEAEVDEVKLSLAISNLIENAIKYNYDDGWVRISLNADHKFFYIKVSDSGVGIPEELQEHIFERFYRVDKARSRETGGTGLGLSITRNAILMHRGAIKVYSKEKEGTTFTIRVPLSYIA